VDDLVGEDAAGGDVVAVAEAARDRQDLVPIQQGWLGEQLINVYELAGGSGLFEGERGFAVAVGAGGTEDEGSGLHRVPDSRAGQATVKESLARVYRVVQWRGR